MECAIYVVLGVCAGLLAGVVLTSLLAVSSEEDGDGGGAPMGNEAGRFHGPVWTSLDDKRRSKT